MYGREELIVNRGEAIAEEIITNGEGHEELYLYKEQADKVMDAYEARIKELEAKLESTATDNVDLGMENFKLKERIKELEASQPKWISVEEGFPKTNKDVYCEDGQVHFYVPRNGWSDRETHYYWLDCELPTTEKPTADIKENLITEQTKREG